VTGAENTASTASPGLAGNVVDPTTGAVMPGNQVSSLPPEAAALPPTAESPGLTDAVVTPETGKRSLPWGLLGLLGLAGLLGRKRRRDQDAAR
jgi:MYXO-CTERM domain-containing protein